jgi:hypothetical protein
MPGDVVPVRVPQTLLLHIDVLGRQNSATGLLSVIKIESTPHERFRISNACLRRMAVLWHRTEINCNRWLGVKATAFMRWWLPSELGRLTTHCCSCSRRRPLSPGHSLVPEIDLNRRAFVHLELEAVLRALFEKRLQ